jgi:hypothetical protein
MNATETATPTLLGRAVSPAEAQREAAEALAAGLRRLSEIEETLKATECQVKAAVAAEVNPETGKPTYSNETAREAECAARIAAHDTLQGLLRDKQLQRNALELTRAKIEYHRQMVQILVALGPAEVQ